MKKYFITGLVILLPLAVTIAIVVFIVNFLTKPFMGFVMKVLAKSPIKDFSTPLFSSEQLIRTGSQIIILIGLFVIIVLIGIITRWFFFNSLIKLSDKLLHKIPVVNKVYKTTQEIIKTLFVTDKNSFKQVVLIPFPDKQTYSIGLVSRKSPQVCQDAVKSEMLSVFVPTTPNPTTGFLLMFKKDDVILLDMKTEDAVKYIVSCGIIIPKESKPKTTEEQ